MILMGLMMSNLTTYVFHFLEPEKVVRLSYAKWNRIFLGEEKLPNYSNKLIYIAYAYISLENRKPAYCSIIEGSIYYFDAMGYLIKTLPRIDLLQEMYEINSDVIDFNYHKEKADYFKQHQWQLNLKQIGVVLDCIWK